MIGGPLIRTRVARWSPPTCPARIRLAVYSPGVDP
jgi:hypothetical protein